MIVHNGLGDVVQGPFRRIAPKAIPIAKQLGMKAMDVRDKGIGAVGDVASKAISAIKDRLARLIRKPPAVRPQPVKLASTEIMPANVSKIINQGTNKKTSRVGWCTSVRKRKNIPGSLLAGSGLCVRWQQV